VTSRYRATPRAVRGGGRGRRSRPAAARSGRASL